MALQAGALVLLFLGLDRAAGRRLPPSVRLAAWLLVLGKLLLPPTLASPFSVTRHLDLSSSIGTAFSIGARDAASSGAALEGSSLATVLAFAVWLAGALAFAGARVLRVARFRRELASEGGPAAPEPWLRAEVEAAARRVGLRRLPRVRVRSAVRGPAVYGAFRPVLLLPRGFGGGESREDVRFVLLHELAHLKRRDPLVSAVGSSLEVLYWFHPLVRLATRRVAALLEMACDETVAGLLREETPRYRDALLLAASRWIDPAAPGLPFHGPSSNLLARVRFLERPGWRRARPRRLATASLALGMLACVLPMGSPGDSPPRSAPQRASGRAPGLPAGTRGAALDTLRRAASGERVGCFQIRHSVLLLAEERGLFPGG
jgi:beta-lactamase regulating signal transducer with metallopeptidase domain